MRPDGPRPASADAANAASEFGASSSRRAGELKLVCRGARVLVGQEEDGIGDPVPAVRDYGAPNEATIEQLRGLPPTLVLVDEPDVLRDEGEVYAAKLRLAGVPVTTVRHDGICHDFMMLNPLIQTNAARAAIAQAITFFRKAFDSK